MTRSLTVVLVATVFVSWPAWGETIYIITEADCRLLAHHEPAPDVKYQLGLDVHGNTVVPADIGGGTLIHVPDRFTIDIDVFLADRLGIPPDRSLFSPEANVATVTISGDQVLFEGQYIGDLRQQAVSKACSEKLDTRRSATD